jgi:hypothetical protein
LEEDPDAPKEVRAYAAAYKRTDAGLLSDLITAIEEERSAIEETIFFHASAKTPAGAAAVTRLAIAFLGHQAMWAYDEDETSLTADVLRAGMRALDFLTSQGSAQQ